MGEKEKRFCGWVIWAKLLWGMVLDGEKTIASEMVVGWRLVPSYTGTYILPWWNTYGYAAC